jgi:hypothetical protein
MKVSKALKEVWDWKDKVYRETKDMNKNEVIRYFSERIEKFLDKTGYKRIKISEGIYKLERKRN